MFSLRVGDTTVIAKLFVFVAPPQPEGSTVALMVYVAQLEGGIAVHVAVLLFDPEKVKEIAVNPAGSLLVHVSLPLPPLSVITIL